MVKTENREIKKEIYNIYIYIYIEREREREKGEKERGRGRKKVRGSAEVERRVERKREEG